MGGGTRHDTPEVLCWRSSSPEQWSGGNDGLRISKPDRERGLFVVEVWWMRGTERTKRFIANEDRNAIPPWKLHHYN